MQNSSYSQRIALGLSLFSLVALLTVIAPIGISFIEQSKNTILVFLALFSVLLFLSQALEKKTASLSLNPLLRPLALLFLTTLATVFFAQDYPIEALLEMGGVFLAFSIIPITLGSTLPKQTGELFLKTLVGGSLAVVLLSVLQLIGFGPAQFLSYLLAIELPTGIEFSSVGPAFVAAQLFFVVIVGLLVQSISTRSMPKWIAVTFPIFVLSGIFFASTMLPNKPSAIQLPSYYASWSIVLDSLKSPKAALIGSGAASYTHVYQTFKPSWLNNTPMWQNTFSQAANTPLTIFTTMGILGGMTWLFVLITTVRSWFIAEKKDKGLLAVVLAGFALQLALPFNTIIIAVQALALSFFIAANRERFPVMHLQALTAKITHGKDDQELKNTTNIITYSTTLLLMAAIGVTSILFAQTISASYVFLQATQKASENAVAEVYTLQQKAILRNPYLDSYRTSYSQTNLLIATALANKVDSTEEEKAQIATLVQQAVREAQAATVINPLKSQNWVNLAEIYTSLIGVTDDAATWSIQSYIKAVETDPNNPITRIKLANVLMQEKRFQQALGIYQQTISLKPDLALSYYNMAKALKIIDTPESLQDARITYQQTLALLEQTSEDYTTVTKELEELESVMKDRDIPLEREVTTAEDQASVETTQSTVKQESQTGEETSALGQQLTNEELPSITEQLIAPESLVGQDPL